VEKAQDPYAVAVRKDQLHEVILEIICDGRGDPDHGEQVLVCAARDLQPGGREGIYLYPQRAAGESTWEGRPGEDGFIYGTEYSSKTSPRCTKCGASPRIRSKNLGEWLDALLKHSGGKPMTCRTDFRRLANVS